MLSSQQFSFRNLNVNVRLFALLIGVVFLVTILPSRNIEKESDSLLYKSNNNMKITVHLDLKGAPPKIEAYDSLFLFFKQLNIDSVLMEYEDMFPYSGQLAELKAENAYTPEDIKNINDLAAKHKLNLIPLVQTFGHLEFVLKLSKFSHLRENPQVLNSICPSDAETLKLIDEMVSQIRSLHPLSNDIHLGADEAYHVAEDTRCHNALRHKFNNSVDSLKLQHISNIAHIAKQQHNFTKVYVWNDMFEKMKASQLLSFNLDKLVVPVVWGYIPDVTKEGYFPDGMFHEYSEVFESLAFGSAFKGANGINTTFMNIRRYVQNLQSYHNLQEKFSDALSGKVTEIFLTGWQRYSHGLPLCELLPTGLPTLVEQIFYIRNWDEKTPTIDFDAVQKFLNCNRTHIADIPYKDAVFYIPYEWRYLNCSFPGVELFNVIEELRLARWKQSISPEITDPLLLEPKLRNELSKIFHDDTVNEWILQNLYNITNIQPPTPQ